LIDVRPAAMVTPAEVAVAVPPLVSVAVTMQLTG
jgi:hypothetical protein